MNDSGNGKHEITLSGNKSIVRRIDCLASRTLQELSTVYEANNLFEAIRANDLPRVQMILNASPSLVNAKSDEGVIPLHAALWNVNPVIVQELLVRGADVNALDAEGDSALHWAANAGYGHSKQGFRTSNEPITFE